MNKKEINIDIGKTKDLTDKLLDKISLNDILIFSFAEPGVNGSPKQIEAIILKDNNINLYIGTQENEINHCSFYDICYCNWLYSMLMLKIQECLQ